MSRKFNVWVLGSLAALSLISSNLLFRFAGISMARSLSTTLIYATSVFGFLYLYSEALFLATKLYKANSNTDATRV
jgi:hypothetical protein